MPVEVHPLYAFLSGALVALFGLVYGWLGFQASPHKPILLIGASGKFLAVTIAVGLYLDEQLSGLTAFVISGDLVFVALWVAYSLNDEPEAKP